MIREFNLSDAVVDLFQDSVETWLKGLTDDDGKRIFTDNSVSDVFERPNKINHDLMPFAFILMINVPIVSQANDLSLLELNPQMSIFIYLHNDKGSARKQLGQIEKKIIDATDGITSTKRGAAQRGAAHGKVMSIDRVERVNIFAKIGLTLPVLPPFYGSRIDFGIDLYGERY